MLDVKGLDFSNIHRIFQQNSIPKAGGSLDLVDFTAHAMSRLDTPVYYCKIKPSLKHGCFRFRVYTHILWTNFSEL
jgi:hypothetical protein